MNTIEIICSYYSNVGRETTYYEICSGKDFMDQEDYDPADFWYAGGGFSITIDGYKTIFNSHNFYNMVKATSFLLNSIYRINGEQCDWFNDSKNDAQISIGLGMNEQLTIRDNGLNEIALSYLSNDKAYERRRGDRFFENLIFDKKQWVEAVSIGLDEYFSVLKSIVDKNPNGQLNKTMHDYYNVWARVAGSSSSMGIE